VLALLIVPLALLTGLELTLRLGGYGYDTHFFRKVREGGQVFFEDNDNFGLRFFPPELARIPTPVRMTATKAPGTVRIFILGESAAMGDPEPAFGAGRYLEVLLRKRFPDRHFEIVNVAMTAINSHAILPIARECATHDGDLWILYMGNNEMVGPFGAATVFGLQAPPLWFVRLSLALQRTRVGQFAVAMGRRLKRHSTDAQSWGGMAMFLRNQVGPDDPRRNTVYRNFASNLHDILTAGLYSGAKVILNTVIVNLKDCPPFGSVTNHNLAPPDLAAYEQHYTDAVGAEAARSFELAQKQYELAAAVDPHVAQLQYRWAQCFLRDTNAAAAGEHFQRACDFDALPFRADSHLNELIREAGLKQAGDNLVLLDTAAILTTNDPVGICGEELFYEHVHFRFDGSYQLARLWAAQVERLIPSLAPNRTSENWAAQEICERMLGLTDWNRRTVVAEVVKRMQQPPLSSQSNNSGRLQALASWEEELRRKIAAPGAADRAREIYVSALKDAPDDYQLHENFGEFLEAVNDINLGLAEWERVRELIPRDYTAYVQIGRFLAVQGKLSEAEASLRKALEIRPNFFRTWLELGKIHADQGKFELALKEYAEAIRLKPNEVDSWLSRGMAFVRLDRRTEAIANFREAARLSPGNWRAHSELGVQLGLDGKFSDARAELEQVARLNPDYAMGHLNLGVALMKEGRLEQAAREFQETLRLDPNDKLAADYLRQAQAGQKSKP
jgi:tetratricopeptide (TPR) repeat protein